MARVKVLQRSMRKTKKTMKKIFKWCGFHEVPMSRCNRTASGSCYPLYLDKKMSDELKEKRNKQGYNIRDEEL